MLKHLIPLAAFSITSAVGLVSPVFATHQNFVGTSANTNANTRAMTRSMPMGALAQAQTSPVAKNQYYRLQLKNGGKYLDASYCSDNIKLSGFSNYDNGACQLWRIIPSGDGYYRLQLKYGGKYLDASYCSDNTKLSGFSDYDNGACQLWQLVPEYVK